MSTRTAAAEFAFEEVRTHFEGLAQRGYAPRSGSCLVDAKAPETYCADLLPQQSVLHQLARNATRALTVGAHVGHSALVMLAANGKLELVALGGGGVAADYLRGAFPGRLLVLPGDPVRPLETMQSRTNYDLVELDAGRDPVLAARLLELLVPRVSDDCVFVVREMGAVAAGLRPYVVSSSSTSKALP